MQRRQVVHAGDVGRPLDVGELLGRLLHAGVEVADDRLGAQHGLAVELDHEPEHPVGGRVLRTHVDDHGLVIDLLDVDVLDVDDDAFGKPQDGPSLASQLVRLGLLTGEQFLGAFGSLDHQSTTGADHGRLIERLARHRVRKVGIEVRGVVVHRGVVAHRGPGAPLNCTGTRPTP